MCTHSLCLRRTGSWLTRSSAVIVVLVELLYILRLNGLRRAVREFDRILLSQSRRTSGVVGYLKSQGVAAIGMLLIFHLDNSPRWNLDWRLRQCHRYHPQEDLRSRKMTVEPLSGVSG